jgi:N-methylhydantoinase A/oxoprolinase/acetone carboxylase beta subunit
LPLNCQPSPQKSLVIACGVLAMDIPRLAEELGLEFETHFLPGGLHEDPAALRARLQALIDEADASQRWARVLVGYGICGRGTVGLKARRVPLFIPRVHDCIALFLGGDTIYRRQFKRYPGTYYISAGWFEEKTEPLSQKGPYVTIDGQRFRREQLNEKYGEKAAGEMFDFFSSWQQNYQRAAFIDTGAGDQGKYAAHTKAMADTHGWRYERLVGNTRLLRAMLVAEQGSAEILHVAPGHVTTFDPRQGGLNAKPFDDQISDYAASAIEVIDDPSPQASPVDGITIGLGIDAGGTYTDTVIYNLQRRAVLAKNKALTTRWRFAQGIAAALAGLDDRLLAQVQLVAVSTTLATNAIVEGEGQPVGLLLMPPPGQMEQIEICHQPQAVITGRMTIDGRETASVDEAHVGHIVREMVDRHHIRAFAVSGYAATINPRHELQVKQIINTETGAFVCCGHELSQLLNFKTRAETAILNARIVPRLVRFLDDLASTLADLRVTAPMVVVKGDGSLMTGTMARQRPVETILSGPAASVAGAHFLTGLRDAEVVDMGGTTTDLATLVEGNARIAAHGAMINGIQTHVQALAMTTSGLGGDSLIDFHQGDFEIGPRRVMPVARLAYQQPKTAQALDFLETVPPASRLPTRNMGLFFATGHEPGHQLNAFETALLALLRQRPYSLAELNRTLNALHPTLQVLKTLAARHVVQCSALTPTDLLHASGDFTNWDCTAARRLGRLMAELCGWPLERLVRELLGNVTQRLAMALMARELDAVDLPTSPAAPFLKRIVAPDHPNYQINFILKHPIIGIGAPVNCFLPDACRMLHTRAIIPNDADVANAIGAITSQVVVRRQLAIRPDDQGHFQIDGLTRQRRFATLAEADNHARDVICRRVRRLGRSAGTSQQQVTIERDDRLTRTATGEQIFLERTLSAMLKGIPDRALTDCSAGRSTGE